MSVLYSHNAVIVSRSLREIKCVCHESASSEAARCRASAARHHEQRCNAATTTTCREKRPSLNTASQLGSPTYSFQQASHVVAGDRVRAMFVPADARAQAHARFRVQTASVSSCTPCSSVQGTAKPHSPQHQATARGRNHRWSRETEHGDDATAPTGKPPSSRDNVQAVASGAPCVCRGLEAPFSAATAQRHFGSLGCGSTYQAAGTRGGCSARCLAQVVHSRQRGVDQQFLGSCSCCRHNAGPNTATGTREAIQQAYPGISDPCPHRYRSGELPSLPQTWRRNVGLPSTARQKDE